MRAIGSVSRVAVVLALAACNAVGPMDSKPIAGGSSGWTLTFGGALADDVASVVATAESVYAAGTALGVSADVPPIGTSRVWQQRGNSRRFVARFDLDGRLVWGRLLDGPQTASRPSLAVTGDALYVAGNGLQIGLSGGESYLVKLSREGEINWTKSRPEANQYFEPRVAATPDGSAIYVFSSTSPTTVASPSSSLLTKLGPDGREIWASRREIAFAQGLATDTQGAAYLIGSESSGGGTGPHVLEKVAADGTIVYRRNWGSSSTSANMTAMAAVSLDGGDLVVAMGNSVSRIAADTGEPRWARELSGPTQLPGSSIITSALTAPAGVIVLTGRFRGPVDFDPGPGSAIGNAAAQDAFVVRLDRDGHFESVRTFGGREGADEAAAAAVLPNGRLLVAGAFESEVDFGLGTGTDLRRSRGHGDAFLTAFPVGFATEHRTQPRTSPVCPARTDGLPRDHAACVADGHGVYRGHVGLVCTGYWCEGEPRYQACLAAGGGIVVRDGERTQYCCKVVYPEFSCPCFGNACD